MQILKRLKKDFWQFYRDIGFKTRSKTSIGIDFGRDSIRCVRLMDSKEGIEILDAIVQRPSEVKELFKKLTPTPDEEIYITFSDLEFLIKRISLPEMARPELGNAIKWELKDQLPFKIDEAVLDFKLIGRRNFPDGSEKLDILAIFAKGSGLEEKIATLKESGIGLISGVSSSNIAIARFVSESGLAEVIAILDIGLKSTRLSVIEKNSLQFVRELNIAGDDITRAMTGTLSLTNGRLELSRDEAEKMKIESGIPFDNPQVLSMIRPVLERLTNQIRTSLEYYEGQFGSPVKKIFLTGNGSRLKGLKGFFNNELSKEVYYLHLPDRIIFNASQPAPPSIEESLPDISVAIGLALDRGSMANLLPQSFEIDRKKRLERFVFRMATILILIFSIFSYSLSTVRLDYLRKVFVGLQTQWRSIEGIGRLKENINKLSLATQAICFQELNPGEVMRELSFITPREISFKQIYINKNKRVLNLKGMVLSRGQSAEARLSRFMETLEDSRFFERVVLVASQRSSDFKIEASEFELECTLIKEK